MQATTEISKRGPYRRHTDEFKHTVVSRSLAIGASVSRVAQEFNVNVNQVFAWRKQFSQGLLNNDGGDTRHLLPVRLAEPMATAVADPKSRDSTAATTGVLTLNAGQAQLRIEGQVDAATLSLVLARLLP